MGDYTNQKRWMAVSAERPCPVCQKYDNCKVSADGTGVWCGRVESSRQNGGGQYLHRLLECATDGYGYRGHRRNAKKQRDYHALATRLASSPEAATKRHELAELLGVTVESLEQLHVGWGDVGGECWTFPERDAGGRVIGLSRRFPDGSKKSIGKRGLIYAPDWTDGTAPVLLVEGGSDTAAGIASGLSVIGRPSNAGGSDELSELLRGVPAARTVIVLGENDRKANGTWPGRAGAIATAKKLAEALDRPISWALPPEGAKDLRAWWREHGADADALVAALELQSVEPQSDGSERNTKKKSQASRLVQIAVAQGAELFHTPDGDAWVTLPVDGHHENHHLGSRSFRRWLSRQYYEYARTAPGAQAMQDALGVLSGIAIFDGPEQGIHRRIAEHARAIYLDLADPQWRAVRIDVAGWRIEPNPPVKFARARGVLALPEPKRGGSLGELRRFVNVGSERDWLLLLGWLVAALRLRGPFPVLVLNGEQGSAKSTTSRNLRALIDPNVAPLRCEPREARDLLIAGTNSWLLAFDNFSTVPVWLSDALCRLSTGGGFATRALYTDGEEMLFDAQRPVLLNGIPELATRSDLLDRTITLNLPPIPDERRRPEAELQAEFAQSAPRILGALLDAASAALRNLPSVQIERLPRMADFALWAVAAEPAFGCRPGAFLEAYTANRENLNESAIEHCAIAGPLLRLIERDGQWQGSASELLDSLSELAGEKVVKRRDWPSKPHVLSGLLRRIAPNLRRIGYEVTFDDRDPRTRRKRIEIRTAEKSSIRSVRSVQASENASGSANAQHPASVRDRSEAFGPTAAKQGKNGSGSEANAANAPLPACSGEAAVFSWEDGLDPSLLLGWNRNRK